MQLAYFAYHFCSNILFLFFLPLYILYAIITGRFGQKTRQRLGLYPPSVSAGIRGTPRIWMHAVSVGEVGAAAAIIEALIATMPDCAIVLSTTTTSGQNFAREKLPANVTRIYAPFDFVPSVRSALSAIRPDILVLLETEIWPNWLAESRRRGVHTALVNGRISVRSIRRYLKIRPLMQTVLAHIEMFSMISPADAQRIQSIGAARDNVITSGNAKYDCLLLQVDDDQRLKLAGRFNLTGNEPVFVAGSTRGSEQQIVLDVYEKIRRNFPDALLIIAPRHIERAREVAALAGEKGFNCQYRTDLDKPGSTRTAPVLVLDTIGELQSLYSIATVVFCGGSLVPLGGQNILEAAVWGKPVLYGPSMEDFQDAKDLLDKTGGGILVADGPDLAEKIDHLFRHPGEAQRVGGLARQAVLFHKGAARKHADCICRLLARR
ncbi:MAG: 3-deoxy-D-manno-octulosonic acid transferase [Desulfobacterales bacterium]|nr:3-deoxy-D-manno-octulosonic acid transferase [Desulfobacterales bacterium]